MINTDAVGPLNCRFEMWTISSTYWWNGLQQSQTEGKDRGRTRRGREMMHALLLLQLVGPELYI